MANPLHADDETVIRSADSGHIQAHLLTLGARNTWLRPGHPFPDGNLPSNRTAFDGISAADVTELLAIRGPLHCVDGWGYLARALSALVSGDAHAARHLAYYAELRAALSMLASEGIGIFNSQNRIVDIQGNLHKLKERPTHDMCWAALAFWGSEPNSLQKMLSAIRINGAPLAEALVVYFPGTTAGNLGAQLIQEWGFDLRVGHEDRDERNLSSYSPNDLTQVATSPPDDVTFIRSLWASFEPGNWLLEKHLLRKLLELQQTVVGGDTIAMRTNEYEHLDARLRAYVSAEFLARAEDPEDLPLLVAAANGAKPAGAHSMIARGALLLGIAAAMSEHNLVAATLQPIRDLSPWWEGYGLERGLWAPGAEPSEMGELWQEIQDALEALAQSPIGNRYEWLSRLRPTVMRLCETERIGLWNLCR